MSKRKKISEEIYEKPLTISLTFRKHGTREVRPFAAQLATSSKEKFSSYMISIQI